VIIEHGLQLTVRPAALAIDSTKVKLLKTMDKPDLLLFKDLNIPNPGRKI
jgi:hypothetical protein